MGKEELDVATKTSHMPGNQVVPSTEGMWVSEEWMLVLGTNNAFGEEIWRRKSPAVDVLHQSIYSREAAVDALVQNSR